jgi:hypothetical protein
MSQKRNSKTDPKFYQIRIKGHLGPEWTNWFEGLTITFGKDGDTLLTGSVVDQSALHGLLKKIRDLGLPLVSFCPLEQSQTDKSDVYVGGHKLPGKEKTNEFI